MGVFNIKTDNHIILNAFNTYFTYIGPNLASSIDEMTRFKLVSHTKEIKL